MTPHAKGSAARILLSSVFGPYAQDDQFGSRKINLSKVFAGQIVCIREVEDQIWLVSFLNYDLGFFDRDEVRVEPAPNPFAPVQL